MCLCETVASPGVGYNISDRAKSPCKPNHPLQNCGSLGLVIFLAPTHSHHPYHMRMPTSQELYFKTNRVFLIPMGIISVASLSTGMWLFTTSSPYFYWFGAPTTFLVGYLLLSCECHVPCFVMAMSPRIVVDVIHMSARRGNNSRIYLLQPLVPPKWAQRIVAVVANWLR